MTDDRRYGIVGNAGFKLPARAATTAAIVLSGEQTVDGVALVTGDRCLVKNQASSVDNGVYIVDTGAWVRAADFDGPYDIVEGSLIRVNEGNANGSALFSISTTDPITIGSSALVFVRENLNYVTGTEQIAAFGQTLINVGATYQIGSGGLAVYLNGLRQRVGTDYAETSTQTITFAVGLQLNDEIDCYIGTTVGNLTAAAASGVSLTDAGDYYVGTTVEAVLQEINQAILPDVGDASAVLTYNASNKVQRWNTPLTANRTATLSVANAKEGASFICVRAAAATGNYTLDVGPGLATLRAFGAWCEVRFDAGSAAWILEKQGFLPSAEFAALALDKGDADATLTVGSSERTSRWGTPLTADRTATLATAGAWNGAVLTVVRSEVATGAFALSIISGALTFPRLAPGQWARFEFTGSAWVCTGSGDCRPGINSVSRLCDDFLGNEINGHCWLALIGTDSSCLQGIVLPDQTDGVVRLTTGANAGATMALNGSQLASGLNWKANQGGLAWECRIALSAITNVCVYLGLTDQTGALEMPFTLGAGDALTSNATNAVGVLFDTAADTDNWWLVGVAADVDAGKQNTVVAPVAATFETWRCEITSLGSALFYRNGALIGATMAGALTGSAPLTPVIAAFSRGAASRTIDVDFMDVRQLR